jgi:hypothetical protein
MKAFSNRIARASGSPYSAGFRFESRMGALLAMMIFSSHRTGINHDCAIYQYDCCEYNKRRVEHDWITVVASPTERSFGSPLSSSQP